MDMKKIYESPIEVEKISIKQLIIYLGKLSIGAGATIITSICSFAFIMITIGQNVQIDSTAIALERPFAMKILKNSSPLEYERLLLSSHYHANQDGREPRIVMALTREDEHGLFEEIGEIVASKPPTKSIFKFLAGIDLPFSNSYAQPISFDWSCYKGNYNFREVFVSSDTVRRYYDNGAVLEYRRDSNGRAIASSLLWIARKECR
jgi:hypothetical protein